MNDTDLIRLKHIRDACEEIAGFIDEREKGELATDRMLLRALTMSIGIIGEAAANLSDEVKQEHSDVPWRQIIGMRNFVFHAYFKVDERILWDTATIAVPELLIQIKQLIDNYE